MLYLITGATGNIGSRVAQRLIERGERPRLFVRDAEKARARFADSADIAVGDLAEPETLAAALTGVDALLLVNSGHALAARDRAAAKAARRAGVGHLVKLSSIDAREPRVGTGVWHADGEAAIRETGLPFTFVQPTGFMVNALWWAQSIQSKGLVRASTGDGRIPFIHSDDIGDVTATVLTTGAYIGKSLPLTGPEALNYAEMAAQIGVSIGRPVGFESISEEEERRQQVAWGVPEPLVQARLAIFRAIREGRMARVTDTVEQVLGRKPIPFTLWAEQNAGAFR